MTLVLFDWTAGGHHALYLQRFAAALDGRFAVAVAAPDVTLAELPGVAKISLGEPRPEVDPRGRPARAYRKLGPLTPRHRRMAAAELRLLREVAAGAEHVVHLYADPSLGALVRRAPLPARVSVCVFYPSAHYPREYSTPLSPRERVAASRLERNIRRFAARPDAHAVLTPDPSAARRWDATWLPEPPVGPIETAAAPRAGAIVWGALAARKGIDRLAAAADAGLEITLVGGVEPSYADTLERLVARMRAAGASVDAHLGRLSEAHGLALLANARCAVLPYPRHIGMSRVLVEAAAAGTPVVADRGGLLGHLVRTHDLGLAVDSADPAALRRGIHAFTDDPARVAARAGALAAFAERFSAERFQAALEEAFTPAPERSRVG